MKDDLSTEKLTQDEICRRLADALNATSGPAHQTSRFPPGLLPDPPRQAAVLIPLLIQGHHWRVLFTRRTSTLPEHSDQVAFPGGRSDPEDLNPEMTALREAHEEIGLQPLDVTIMGQLHELHTISNYCIRPVVGVIPWPYVFKLARHEVSRVFSIPLDWLVNLDNHEIHMRELPQPYSPLPVIYFKPYSGELLWGVSAQITLDLLFALRLLNQ
jgi:8-oxo-dGTP pyrophosphatase MutT (NUDIX family)